MPVHLRWLMRWRGAVVLLVALGLLGASFTIAPLPPAHASPRHAAAKRSDLPTPPWWNGSCDSVNFLAATKGATDYAGVKHPNGIASYSLGASYRGVTACGPRPLFDKSAPVDEPEVKIGGWGEFEWECTELVFRYMYLAFHQNAYSAWGASVVYNYRGTRLKPYNNDTPGHTPQPGDVISFGDPAHASASKPGHTAIVIPNDASHPVVDSDGNGFITILQQNTPNGFSPIQPLAVKDWVISGVSGALPAADWLHDPSSDSQPPTGASPTGKCVIPAIDPTAAKEIADVKLTTSFVDWSGTLQPQGSAVSFGLDQSFVDAVRLGTSDAGSLTIQNTFCNDGHAPPYDSATYDVGAGQGPGWIFQSEWYFDTNHLDDVGPVMETMAWNGAVGQVMFYTIRQNPIGPLGCPTPQDATIPGLSITGLNTASQVSQTDVSSLDVSASYTGSDSPPLTFALCIDGTTRQINSTTLSSGANDYGASDPMAQNYGTGCQDNGCQLFGAARWYVEVNHQVVAQVPFVVTQQ